MNNIRNFVIIAHIDHGKSTLADRFLEITKTVEHRDLKEQHLDRMDLERERGITIKLQPVRMLYRPKTLNSKSEILNKSKIQNSNDQNSLELRVSSLEFANSEYILNLIDTPGHVDFSYEVSRSLAAVEGAILVVDATQGIQAQTLANLHQAQKQNLVIIPVVNKIDLPNADIEKTRAEIVELLGVPKEGILAISAKTGEGVEKVLEEVIKKVPAPKERNPDLSRALIFDSVFDDYRGVVAYVRAVDGKFQAGEKIQFLGAKTQDEILEVGYFSPDYKKKAELLAGEIGYIVTGLKDITKCRVGDTISKVVSHESSVVSQSLPGYKEPKPMIFAGIYSADGEINKLREALEKLKLNDASLIYEVENSTAFGFGFKVGFLGLLHLEIVQERLEREHGLNLIITTPKVSYQESIIGGQKKYQEPWASLEIIGPEMYLGKIMELAHRHRAIQKDINYLGDRAISYFEAPLSEIIMGFYDELKSVSQGYASMNYEFIDYREGDLVQMDVLIANEKVEALSQVVPRVQLQARAFNIVKKLKDLIPRQWFDVAIQAAIGGKILARENIPAMKKDVTGYLYGGDISRKKKLWAKQAKGKKKMKKLGKVDIPSDVFIKLLRN